jgi:hypothetical protein
MREATLGAVELGQRLVLPQAIPADGGTADQECRAAVEPIDQPHHRACHAYTRGQNAATPPQGPQAPRGWLAGEVDDGVDCRIVRNLREAGDEMERRSQQLDLSAVAHQHGDLMTGLGQRFDQAAADEAGGAGHQHVLSAGKRRDEFASLACGEPPQPSRRAEVAQSEHENAERRHGRDQAERPVVRRLDCSRLLRPSDQDGQREREDCAVVEREQRVGDALARREPAARVLLDEIDQRDDDLDEQHCHHQHRPDAMHLEAAEQHEQHGRAGCAQRAA